jgi:ATP phosphoribosyltransferase regulatory subunit
MELIHLLKLDHLEAQIDLDITLVPHLSYYTGFVFQGFGGNLGFPVASGGRYDDLLAKFNRPCPATGFGIRLDRLLSAIEIPAGSHASKKSAVIYNRENAGIAMRFAAEEREKGRAIVLQHADGIDNLETFEKQFEAVNYFLDRTEIGE